tara:strand:- start:158 stop:388 length:231 start_codon:yes stop_codon:yes gene_type:complete
MTGKGFLDTWLRGGLAGAASKTGGITGLGPKFAYDSKKGFIGSNKPFSGYLGDQEQSGLGGRDLTGKSGLGGLFQI